MTKRIAIFLQYGCLIGLPLLTHKLPAQQTGGDVLWHFNEPGGAVAHDAAGNLDDRIAGLWRRVPGVDGSALEFDGYTTHIVREAKNVPRLGNAFTVSAWLALNAYPWNWLPIVDQSEDDQVGYFFGIDAFGHVASQVAVNGVWQKLTTEQKLPLKRWVHITAVFDSNSGLTILVNGEPAGTLKTTGSFWQATEADLYVGRVRG